MLMGANQQELRFSEDAAQKIKDMRNQFASYQEADDKVKKLRREGARIFEQISQSLSQNSGVQNVVRLSKLRRRSDRA
jgi:ribosomal protein L18E